MVEEWARQARAVPLGRLNGRRSRASLQAAGAASVAATSFAKDHQHTMAGSV